MGFLLHRGGDQRYVLQSVETGGVVGLLFAPLPTESRRAFEYDYGSTNNREEIVNIDAFPEFSQLTFFTIESFSYEHALRSPGWESVRSLLSAETKFMGCRIYDPKYTYKPPEDALIPVWQQTPPNLQGSWKIPIWALWVNATGVYLGNRNGLILAFNHQGEPLYQHQLPKLTRALGENDQGLYAICDDGQVYDLNGKLPQAVYNARTPDISVYRDCWLQAFTFGPDEALILDAYGTLTSVGGQWQQRWQIKTDYLRGWFLQADDRAVYVGHAHGVSCLSRKTGKVVWQQSTPAPVMDGVLWGDRIVVGTSDGTLYRLAKAGNFKTQTTEIEPWASYEGTAQACTITGNGSGLVVADYQSQLYGFNATGDRIWQKPITYGTVLNLKTWGDCIYATTTDGTLACFELP